MDIFSAIRTRRSHKLFTGQAADDAVLVELVELATWAPNHKLTEPWRFVVVRSARTPALVDAVVQALQAGRPDDPALQAQVQKMQMILGKAAGAIALIRPLVPTDPVRDREDYAACACALQHIQLGAWGHGLASYWTTSPAIVGKQLQLFWGVQPGEELVGAIILGVAAGEAKAVRYKKAEDLTTWL